MNKRASEMFFFVSIALVVLTLAVIIGFFASANWKADIDKATCKESAILRGTIPSSIELAGVSAPTDNAKDLVSLQCKTNRICVTDKAMGDGNCDDGLGSKFSTKRISGDVENKKNQIRMILAREMADCWGMLGEGNLQIFKREATINPLNGHIVVCSRVMFDDTVLKDIKEVDGMSVYLLTHKVKGKETSYWDYFRNTPDGDTLQLINGDPVVQGNLTGEKAMDLSKQKAIFYAESSLSEKGATVGYVASGTALIAGVLATGGMKGLALFSNPVGAIAFTGIVLNAGELSDNFYSWFTDSGFTKENKYVGGVFLTDYTKEGFSGFEKQNIKFENIA